MSSQQFNPETGRWEDSKPLPYYPQLTPSLLARLFVLTIGRRYRCQQGRCSWPATEVGYLCDIHAGHVD